MKRVLTTLFAIAACTACITNSALAEVDKNEIPTQDAKPLKEVVVFLESQGYENIVRIEFDHFSWEMEILIDGKVMGYRFDPVSLKLVRKLPREKNVPQPPADGKSIQEILAIVEAGDYPGVFREINFVKYEGTPIWAVQVLDNKLNRLIGVEPVSGNIIGEKQEKVE